MQGPDGSEHTIDREEIDRREPAGHRRRVVVVGAGVSGLLTAYRLRAAGHDVIVLEAGPRVGGHVLTVDLAGRRVDVGAEAVHLQVPAAAALVAELGLADDLVGARPHPSYLLTPRGRRPLPAGVGPAGPTRLRPVLRSGVLSVPGLVRAGLEPLVAGVRGRLRGEHDDLSVGGFVSARFGGEVSASFVDPLLGGLHSGDVDRLSLRACAPSLVPAATTGASLVRRRRAAGPPRGGVDPVAFGSWPQGLSRLVETLARDLTIRTGCAVQRVAREGTCYLVEWADASGSPGADGRPDGPGPRAAGARGGGELVADAVVLAIPAPAATRLLRGAVPAAARALGATRVASAATVVLGYPREAVRSSPALRANGLLVASSTGCLLKAVTHLSTKWPHLDDPDTYLLRMSAGRAGGPAPARDAPDGPDALDALDDDALVLRLREDLARFEGVAAEPSQVLVQRWRTGIPQLHVGHIERLRAARDALARQWPGVALAGASYDGIGLTSCLASAERAAQAVQHHLGGLPDRSSTPSVGGPPA